MSTTTRVIAPQDIDYPESDGEPLAENTLQYKWIALIKGGLDIVFCDDPNAFVAADLFWYAVEGDNTIRRAPDVMVALGRPKGERRSYLQWLEADVAPQVVFEILSPGNRGPELALKFQFYATYGVEEYYIYDPEYNTLEGWLRGENGLTKIAAMNGWTSPRLDVLFEHREGEFHLYQPDGRRFASIVEHAQRADEQQRRAERLAAQLKALGIDPEA